MAYKERDEIVGKQFIAVEGFEKIKRKDIENWDWKSGVVRAVTDRDPKTCKDVQVLVEYDDSEWQDRKWIKIHDECQYFAVEKTLVWAPCLDDPPGTGDVTDEQNNDTKAYTHVPSLTFIELVDKSEAHKSRGKQPVKSLHELRLNFASPENIKPYQDKGQVTGPLDDGPEQQGAVRLWAQYQDGQRILLQTPSILVGDRIEVYRREGTTQWYTAVINSYNETTKELEVTDDTVLEKHTEDPATVQIRLIGQEVIESILRGEDSRVRPTRTRRSVENKTPPSTSAKPGSALSERIKRGQSQSPCPQTTRASTPQSGRKSASTTRAHKEPSSHDNGRVLTKTAGSDQARKRKVDSVHHQETSNKAVITESQTVESAPGIDTSSTAVHTDTSPKSVSPEPSSKQIDADASKPSKKRSLVVPLCDISPKGVKPKDSKSVQSQKLGTKNQSSAESNLIPQPVASRTSADTVRQSSALQSKEISVSQNSGDSIAKEKATRRQDKLKTLPEESKHKAKLKSGGDEDSSADTVSAVCGGTVCIESQESSPSGGRNDLVESCREHVSASRNCPNKYNRRREGKSTESSRQGNRSPISRSRVECGTSGSTVTTGHLRTGEELAPSVPGVVAVKNRPGDCSLASDKRVEKSVTDLALLKTGGGKSTESVLSCDNTEGCTEQEKREKTQQEPAAHESSVIESEEPSEKKYTETTSETVLSSSQTGGGSVQEKLGKQATAERNRNSSVSNSIACRENGSEPVHGAPEHLLTDKSGHQIADKKTGNQIGVDTEKREGKTNDFRKFLQRQLPLRNTDVTLNHHQECNSNSPKLESKDMHYKKYLLGDYQKKEGGQTSPVKADEADRNPRRLDAEGINLNHSLTDQLARRNKDSNSDPRRTWEDGVRTNGIEGATSRGGENPTQLANSTNPRPRVGESAFVSHSYDKTKMDNHTSNDERLRQQQQQHESLHKAGPSHTNSDNPRETERKASPLVFDKSKRVEPYRDPELLKRDEMQRLAALQSQRATPLSQPSVVNPLAAAAAAQSVATSAPLPALATTRPQALLGLPAYPASAATLSGAAAMSAIPTPLSLHHFTGALDPAAVSSLSVLQQQQAAVAQLHQLQLLQSQQSHLMPYAALQSSIQTRQLEMLWQQKYPNIPVPPGWILHQYQDELLRDVNPMLAQRDLLDRERRERELALEREHELRELRDREERERVERERLERDRVERDRQERERREREERERVERERALEREKAERREKEAAQFRERERQRREILHESKAAADAVEKHFQESLRLASQKASSRGIWTPTLSGGQPLVTAPPGGLPKGYNPAAFSHLQSQHSPQDRKAEDKPRVSPHDRSSNPSPQDLSQKCRKAQDGDLKPDVKGLPHHKLPPNFPDGYPFSAIKGGLPATTGHPGMTNNPTTSGHQIKQEPNFSLYGYPHPSTIQQMYISQDKLSQGLKDEKKPLVKSEPGEMRKPAMTSPPPGEGRKPPMTSPPPLVKTENKSSVIVENKVKEALSLQHGQGSISQGTSRCYGPPDTTATAATQGGPQASRAGHATSAHSPMRVSSPQQLGLGTKQPAVSIAQSQAVAAAAMHQAYLAAISQASGGALPAGYSQALKQGLVPNPIYTQNSNPAQSAPREQLSPSSQKRRAQQKTPEAIANQNKKPRVEQANAGTVPTSTSPSNRAAGPQGAFIDSFKTFVENTVTSAFFHDHNNPKSSQFQQQPKVAHAAPVPQPVVSQAAKTEPSSNPAEPAAVSASIVKTASTTTTSSTVSSNSSDSKTNSAPGGGVGGGGVARVNSPGSISSMSSIQDTINRVANGLDTDSDTLSAPSPPLNQGSKDAPSPARSTSSNSAAPRCVKKAILQRYSDEIVPAPPPPSEASNSSQPEQPQRINKDTGSQGPNKTGPATPLAQGDAATSATARRCDTPCDESPKSSTAAKAAPLPATKTKSPFLTQLKENEEANTSASEAESHDEAKPKKKGQKRKVDTKSEQRSATPVSVKKQRESDTESGHEGGKVVKKQSKQQHASDTESTSKEPPKKKKKVGKEEERSGSKPGTPKPVVAAAPPRPSSWHCERKMQEKRDEQLRQQRKGKKDREGDKGTENPSTVLAKKPLNREPVAKLRKMQEPFLQEDACMEIAPKLMKCRECKLTPTQIDKKQINIFCRFYAFRRLKFNPKGIVSIAGFSEPSDADVDDIELWYPRYPIVDPQLSVDMAKYLMHNVGDRFCELVEQEKEAMMWVSPDTKIVWKRAVQGVREMCDVCDTTLFNMHWCCHKCGFVVCIDCYRHKTKKVGGNQDKHMKEEAGHVTNQKWLTCSASRQQHEPDRLRITQIIPSDVLWALGTILHEVRDAWNIPSNCPCGHRSQNKGIMGSNQNGVTNHLLNAVTQCIDTKQNKAKPLVNGIDSKKKAEMSSLNMMSPLNLLAEAAVSRESEIKKETEVTKSTGGGGGGDKCSTLRDLLTRQGMGIKAPPPENNKKPKGISSNIDDVLLKLVENKAGGGDGEHHGIRNTKFSHYVPRSGQAMQGRKSPIPTYTLKETSVLFPDVPHSWLDHGRLLRLHDPRCANNLSLFQQQWRRAQPVLASQCHRLLSRDLWTPHAFGKEFGHQENDLVNCKNLVTIIGHKMKVFWDGFERMSCRLKDNKGNPLIVKLKDWPPTEDFSELMPNRFKDLMQALPLPEYTQRNGTFNLASRLPEFFVKPDLGPKMYNAYGSALHPRTGTTNLHLDVSDAVNLMVYVGIPDDDSQDLEQAAIKLLEDAGCCEFTMARVREAGEKPGALWHIFDPQDADKIRELLNKVAKERGEEVSLDNDPIHDQAFYLDKALRERLLREYDVQAYTIVQYMGDAVFIPAGAPHQVQNLHSCIKAAEDFVSPENINHCFFLTQEFRHLSDQHSNHEDKLQIKNMIYHAVKDAAAVLKHACQQQ